MSSPERPNLHDHTGMQPKHYQILYGLLHNRDQLKQHHLLEQRENKSDSERERKRERKWE